MACLDFVLVLVLSQVFLFPVLSLEAPPIAKPNCSNQCGGVDIPYPFGIGLGCSIGDWFEIICANNNTVALLKRMKLTVTNILVEVGTITVRNPITFFECETEHEDLESPSLRGSPFYYSQSRNIFASVSCGWIALMKNFDSNVVGGCLSICSSTTGGAALSNNTCDGNLDCCQTTIPFNLQRFETGFLNPNQTLLTLPGPGAPEKRMQCKYAFLVDRHWFSSNVSDVYALQDLSHVPVVLEWELYNKTEQLFGAFVETYNRSEYEESAYNGSKGTRRGYQDAGSTIETGWSRSSFCEESASLMKLNMSTLKCFCPRGYDGNPYLLQGCYDIDECKKGGFCGPNLRCKNYAGGYMCYLPKTKASKMITIGICTGFGSLLLLVGARLLYGVVKKKQKTRRKRKNFKRNGGLLLEREISSAKENSLAEKTKTFSSKELDKATNKFSADRILGQGGQGTVYKGMLADGKIVAVKKSKLENQGHTTQFINEVFILSQINHRNVVKLHGCCLETEVPLLVYEFVPNGTLSQHLYSEKDEFPPLTWKIRVRIATEVAGALSYLHLSASAPILHRDIKPKNILLDDKYRAKIADFGISRSIPLEKTHMTTQAHGTIGYVDPEYFQSGQLTDKSDVYSFGVVLVELLSGQKSIPAPTTSNITRGLVLEFIQCIKEDRLFDIVDPRVVKEGEKEEIIAFANIAKQCLNSSGKKRPTMRDVANLLEDIERTLKPCDADQADMEVAEYAKDEIELNSASCSSSALSSTFGTETFSPSKGMSLLSRKSK